MPQPTASDVHVDATLTQVSLGFAQQAGFVAQRAFQPISVAKQSDKYFTYDGDMFRRRAVKKRAPGTSAPRLGFKLSTDSYHSDVYSAAFPIADQTRANSDAAINLNVDGTTFLTQQMMLEAEADFASVALATSVWDNEDGTTTVWTIAGGGDPIFDIRTGCRTVQDATGFRANRAIMTQDVFDTLVDHPDFVDRIKAGQTDGPATMNEAAMAAVLGLDMVMVAGAVETTSNEGASSETTARLAGSEKCLLYYAPPMPGRMTPAAGYRFTWSGLNGANAETGRIKVWRDEDIESDIVEIQAAWDNKIVSTALGYLYYNVLTT